MTGAEISDGGTERPLDGVACRQSGQDEGKIAPAGEAQGTVIFRTGRDQHRAAAVDETGDVIEVKRRQHAAIGVAVEDQEIEFAELVDEKLVLGEGDEGQFLDRRAVVFVDRPEDREVHKVDGGI